MSNSYLQEVMETIDILDESVFRQIGDEIVNAAKRNNIIFVGGQDKGCLTADHFANDISKSGGGEMTAKLGVGIKVYPLNTNMSFLTALANDISFKDMYAEAIKCLATPGDLLILFSLGISPEPHLSQAAKAATEKGMRVVCVTGHDADDLERFSTIVYKVPSRSPEVVQDVHLFLVHGWTAYTRNTLAKPVVFLDRDGVINYNKTGYVKSWGEFEFIEDSLQSIKRLCQAGFAVVVITNQSIINRMLVSEKQLEFIHRNMAKSLADQGAWISAVYYCPHVPEDKCECRKPKSGLIEQAFSELPLDRNQAFFVGDSVTDVVAGNQAGIRTILLQEKGNFTEDNSKVSDAKLAMETPEFTAPRLSQCVEWIIHSSKDVKQEVSI